MIIDSHVHLIGFPSYRNLGDRVRTKEDIIGLRTRHPEIYKARLLEEPIDNADDLIGDLDRRNIDIAVVQATAGYISNDLVAQAAGRYPGRLHALVRIGHDQLGAGFLADPTPAREKAVREIERGIEILGMKGVGETFIRAFTRAMHPEEIAEDLAPIMETIARYRVPIQFPTGWSQFRGGLYHGNPVWVDEVAARYPEVPIILTKMGRGIDYYFDMSLAVAMRNANVYFDIIGTRPDHLTKAVRSIGAHRIMFGSDWAATWRWLSEPSDLYTMRFSVLAQARIDPEERAQILGKTAMAVFGLKAIRTTD